MTDLATVKADMAEDLPNLELQEIHKLMESNHLTPRQLSSIIERPLNATNRMLNGNMNVPPDAIAKLRKFDAAEDIAKRAEEARQAKPPEPPTRQPRHIDRLTLSTLYGYCRNLEAEIIELRGMLEDRSG